MKKIAVFIVTAFALLCPGMESGALASTDSIKLLNRAYEKGEIDYQAALNYKIYAIFKKNRLPKSFQSDEPVKSATPVILEARQNPAMLYRENQFILYRPADAAGPNYYGAGIAVWTYDSPGGHFKIHYTEDNTNGDAVYGYDGVQGTIPQYVIDLAGYFDNVWTQTVTGMGYPAPPSDGLAGGDNRFDVYLVNLPSTYGYTTYDSSASNVYIVMHNNFTSGFPKNLDPDTRKGAQKVTAAHEFFHACQLQYTTNINPNSWWMEATATWMEDAVYPSVKDYLNYLGRRYDDANDNGAWDSGETFYDIDGVTAAGTTGRTSRWFDMPEISLDSTAGAYEYGTAVWGKYLSERYGNGIIKSIWQRIGAGSTAVTAVSDELASRGTSLGSALIGFEAADYKRDYTDGSYYPIQRHNAAYASYPQALTGSLNHLSANVYAFKPDGATTAVTFTFNNMNSGNLAVKLILTKTSGGYDEQDIGLNGPSVSARISDLGAVSTYSKIALQVTNISASQDSAAYSVNVDKGAVPTNNSGGSGGGGGGGCFIATAAYGSYLAPEVMVLRDFRDSRLLTNSPGKAFVWLYYGISPPIAFYISRHEGLKAAVRLALTPIVYGIKYPRASLGVMAFIALSIIFLFRRMRFKGRAGEKARG